MANSKITITFTDDAVDNDSILFNIYKIGAIANKVPKDELFVNRSRIANGEVPTVVTVNPPYPIAATASAYNYQYYFNIDYNGFNLFNITWTNNIVVIEATNTITLFSDFIGEAHITAVIENTTESTFKMVSDNISESIVESKCSHFLLNIQTTETPSKIYINKILASIPDTDTLSIELLRGINYNIELVGSDLSSLYYPTETTQLLIGYLSTDNVSINVVPLISGATVTVNILYDDNLSLEYSKDNINWQVSNIFTGQVEGYYSMYIRDQYGCVLHNNYTIDSLGTRLPYLEISDANSISFKEQVDRTLPTFYENDENSLDYQGIERLKYCENVLLETRDPSKIQIKTNFNTLNVTLRKDDLTETVISTEKKTSNLSRFKSLDGFYYSYGNGYTAIYFTTGNTYDENDIINGDFTLNGNLPDMAIVGQYITLKDIGNFEIVETTFDYDKAKKIIIIEYEYNGIESPIIVKSIYDLLPFEIYEFEVLWGEQGVGLYDLLIENTDPNNGTVYHLSENIEVSEKHNNTVAIIYYNNNKNNRSIFYKFGIKHFIRVPIDYIRAVPKDEVEINVTDDDSDVVTSSVHKSNEFAFKKITKDVMNKIAIATSCENLFIQNIGYVKDGSISSDGGINTNLYNVNATLVKKGINYNNNRTGQDSIDINYIDFDIPAFITSNSGFIKI